MSLYPWDVSCGVIWYHVAPCGRFWLAPMRTATARDSWTDTRSVGVLSFVGPLMTPVTGGTSSYAVSVGAGGAPRLLGLWGSTISVRVAPFCAASVQLTW